MKLNGQNQIDCSRGKAACRFSLHDYNESLNILKSLSKVDNPKDSVCPQEAEIKAVVYAKANAEGRDTDLCEEESSPIKDDKSTLIKVSYRPVDNNLIKELYDIEKKKLSQLAEFEARKGNGFCTDYKLFTRNSHYIKELERDLKDIVLESLGKEACSLKYDSFFNIFKSGSESVAHAHLSPHDKRFDLGKHKYSLVYYLDVGDQNCEHPGILKMHDPEVEILPKKGMVLIFPACRKHSSFYGGSEDRLMVGTNFYAFSTAFKDK